VNVWVEMPVDYCKFYFQCSVYFASNMTEWSQFVHTSIHNSVYTCSSYVKIQNSLIIDTPVCKTFLASLFMAAVIFPVLDIDILAT
jgi:hypothetical protein